MRLDILNGRRNPLLVGIETKFTVLVHGVDVEELENLLLRVQLGDISKASIDGVQTGKDGHAVKSCRWEDRVLRLARADFEIAPGEPCEFTATFSVQRGPVCEPVAIVLRSICYTGHSGFTTCRHKGMH